MGGGRSRVQTTTTSTTPSTTEPAHVPKLSRRNNGLSESSLLAILREELELVINNLMQQEIAKQMDEKLSALKITKEQRTRIHKKILDEARKQVPELLNRILAEQYADSEDTQSNFGEYRIGDDIEKEIENDVKEIVQRSLEKAVADEIFEKEKSEKITTDTPTVQPKFEAELDLGIFGYRHIQVFMVLLFLAISFVQRVDLAVAIVAISDNKHANPNFKEYKWDESVKGFLLSSFYWGYIFMQLPGGVLAEKYGPKLVMSISMIMCSTTSLFMPVATLRGGWIGLYVLKVLQGISQGAFVPGVYVFTAKWIPPQEKAKLFTPAFGGMQLGTVIGMPVSGFLCASPLGWPSTFFFSAIIGYLWVVLWIFAAANSPAVHRSISREEQLYIEGSFGFGEITVKGAKKNIPWMEILTSRPFIALMVGHFGENWAFFTLLSEMPIYLNHVLNIDITYNTLLTATSYGLGWIMILILGFLASFFREKNVYSVGIERKLWTSIALYGSAVTFFLLGFTQTDHFNTVMGLLTATIVMNSTIYNGLLSNHADLSPNYVGVLIGLSNTIGNVSSLLAPLFVGLIVTDPHDVEQWSQVFLFVGGLLVICNTIYLVFGSSDIQPWNTPNNLHLQLEKDPSDEPTFGSRHHRYMVSDTRGDIAEEENYHRKHWNSI